MQLLKRVTTVEVFHAAAQKKGPTSGGVVKKPVQVKAHKRAAQVQAKGKASK